MQPFHRAAPTHFKSDLHHPNSAEITRAKPSGVIRTKTHSGQTPGKLTFSYAQDLGFESQLWQGADCPGYPPHTTNEVKVLQAGPVNRALFWKSGDLESNSW